MSKRLSRWWINIAANGLVLIVCVTSGVGLCASPQDVETGKTTGQTASRLALGKYGSTSGLKDNAINPLVSSESMLNTVDGSTAFDAQLSFPNSNKFLEVFIQPGSTGDLSTVIIGQDLDFDGSTDYSYQLPVRVSGICANGVISCSPGTWENCTYYIWKADSTGKITLDDVYPDKLGGCYCINTGCGNNLVWNNTEVILDDLGGGAVGAVQKANSGFTISDVRVQDTAISYYGQDTSRTTTTPGINTTGEPPEAAFLRTPMAMPTSVQNLAQTQAGDPDSLYRLVSGIDTQKQQNRCSVIRNISMYRPNINDIIVPLGGTGTVYYCGANCINVVLGQVGDNYWRGSCRIFEKYFNVLVKQPDLIQSATIVRAKWDDYMQVWIDDYKVWSGPNNNFPPETAGRCELSTSWDRNPHANVTSYFKRAGEIKTKIRVSVTGRGEGYAFVQLKIKPDRCVVESSISDGCAALDSRSDCELQSERVDDVTTWRSGNPTGLVALPSTRTLTEGPCTEDVTMDWWHKERTYFCERSPYDFSHAEARYNRVVDSISDGSSFYEDQILNADGTWSDRPVQAIALPDVGNFDECEQACKTRKVREDSQATLTGVSANYQTNIRSWDILYHSCVDGTCPTEAGEEVLRNCQCLNEFTEAATLMQMMRKAGQDVICSDGVAKP